MLSRTARTLRGRWVNLPRVYRWLILAFILLLIFYVIKLNKPRSHSVDVPTKPTASFIFHPLSHIGQPTGASERKKIPKIIHQTWKTRNQIPVTFRPWMESWLLQNTDWEYWFWTDTDMRKLVEVIHPGYLDLYDSYPTPGYRADAFRYFVLYEFGGVYADLDMECLYSLDDIAAQDECVVSQEPLEHAHFLSDLGPPLVSNALMACRPNHPFFANIISRLPSYTGWFGWNDILHATGPYMLTDAFRRYGHYYTEGSAKHLKNAIRLAKPDEFQPTPDNSMVDTMRSACLRASRTPQVEPVCQRLAAYDFGKTINPTAYTNHHWTHTWADKYHDPWGVFNARDFFDALDLPSVLMKLVED